ncbi:acetyltransferase [Streptomyces pactum]|uniref:Lysine N-acyltransferase MbtK n=1 Tax=Streptomyces pactum TaxID=68249 RepID=A0ABS0NMW1_9ACTN|nr:GNAT family N-acetyltransferase [Streptomyces pactum]MBH5336422.1 acetyltransferase [Streptomyces pactum]
MPEPSTRPAETTPPAPATAPAAPGGAAATDAVTAVSASPGAATGDAVTGTAAAAGTASGRAPVHEETVEGFGTIRVVPVDPERDVDLIHGWVVQERAKFWGMGEADRDRVLEIYSYLDSLTTHHAYLVHRNGTPVALFQTYQPEADPVGDYYDVRPGDFGVHLLIGPADGTGERGFTGVLLAALIRFVLSDPSRKRIVLEPDARNEKAIARVIRAGFTLGPQIDLPEKRAQLAFLERAQAGLPD